MVMIHHLICSLKHDLILRAVVSASFGSLIAYFSFPGVTMKRVLQAYLVCTLMCFLRLRCYDKWNTGPCLFRLSVV